jgi:hypothetical protein
VNADNASSNDTQVAALAGMPNSFELDARVRCFNHTLQLSAKALLRPFNAGFSDASEDAVPEADGLLDMEDDDEDEDENEGEGDSSSNNGNNLPDVLDDDDNDDGVDELASLDLDAREEFLADTAALRQTVSKVSPTFYGSVMSH